MQYIPLTQGKVALVSDEDFEYLSIWSWVAAKDGRGNLLIHYKQGAYLIS